MRLNLMSEATNLKIIKPFRQLDFSFSGNETRLFEFKVKRMHIFKKSYVVPSLLTIQTRM